MIPVCRVCGDMIYARGLCNKHWEKLRRYGDPLGGREYSAKAMREQIGVGVTRCPPDKENVA